MMCKEAMSMPNIILPIKLLHLFCVTSMPLYLFLYCAIPVVPEQRGIFLLEGYGNYLGHSTLPPKTSNRNDTVVRALGLIPALCHVGLLLVVTLPHRFFAGFSSFLPSTKTNSPNSNSTKIEDHTKPS